MTDDDDDDDDDDPQYIIEDETLLYVSETEERPTHQIADLNHLTWAETWDRLVKMEQMGLVKRGHHEGRTTWAKS